MYFSSYLHTLTNIHKNLQVKCSLEFQTCIEASGKAFLEDRNFMLIAIEFRCQKSQKEAQKLVPRTQVSRTLGNTKVSGRTGLI